MLTHCKVAILLLVRLIKQSVYLRFTLSPKLHQILKQHHVDLTKKQQLRSFRNYSLYAVCINAEHICFIQNRKLTRAERERISLFSVVASLCDDLIDEYGWTTDELMDLLTHHQYPITKQPQLAQLIIHLNSLIHHNFNVHDDYYRYLTLAFKAQSKSMLQQKKPCNLNEIIAITMEKSTYSNVLIGYLLAQNISETEVEYLKHLGYLGQLTNDLFDVYKDFSQHIQTFITQAKNLQEVSSLYKQELEKLYKLIEALPIKNKKEVRILSSCITVFGLTAISVLQQTAQQFGDSILNWKKIPRRYLIVDMEKCRVQYYFTKHFFKIK